MDSVLILTWAILNLAFFCLGTGSPAVGPSQAFTWSQADTCATSLHARTPLCPCAPTSCGGKLWWLRLSRTQTKFHLEGHNRIKIIKCVTRTQRIRRRITRKIYNTYEVVEVVLLQMKNNKITQDDVPCLNNYFEYIRSIDFYVIVIINSRRWLTWLEEALLKPNSNYLFSWSFIEQERQKVKITSLTCTNCISRWFDVTDDVIIRRHQECVIWICGQLP